VYSLPPGSRVKDAIESAGGPSQDASIQGLNLAAPLQDGDLIWIPAIPKANPTSSETDKTPGEFQAPIPTPVSTGLVNINTATLEELDTLPGIGPVKAQSIIDHRNRHGPFNSIEAIQDVVGIGPATYEGLKDLITVQATP
jgi:competence protein ComEA